MNLPGLVLVTVLSLTIALHGAPVGAGESDRARDLGIPFEGEPGPLNAITDVAGIEVGMSRSITGMANWRLAKDRYARVSR